MKAILQSAAVQTVLAWLALSYGGYIARSLRWRIDGAEYLRAEAGGAPVIVVFWHETLPAMPALWVHMRRLGMQRPAVGLASRHRDGQLVGRILRGLGIGLVSGSTSRGGAAGLRGLLRALQAGQDVILTPDGPRGPRRVAAPGVAQLAAMSGVRVVPCAALTRHAITLTKSWDSMRIPLPFGAGVVVCGKAIIVERASWQDGLADIAAGLDGALARAADLLG